MELSKVARGSALGGAESRDSHPPRLAPPMPVLARQRLTLMELWEGLTAVTPWIFLL